MIEQTGNYCNILKYTGTDSIYVPVGGKKMVCFMDDFNMPAKDDFGSQPPLELIKLWLDYGFWYDRQKQLVKYVKVQRNHNNQQQIVLFILKRDDLFLFSGHVLARGDGTARRRSAGDFGSLAEQVQPLQHDFPSGTKITQILLRIMKCRWMTCFVVCACRSLRSSASSEA